MATKKKKSTAKKKPARKVARRSKPAKRSAKSKPTTSKLAHLFEGPQAMIPGVAPRKKSDALTYIARGADGTERTVTMPEDPQGLNKYVHRRRPQAGPYSGAKLSARMELRLLPAQATAYDRTAAAQRLTRAEWIRLVCDKAVHS